MKVVVLRTVLITILLQETLGKVTLSPYGDVRVCKGDDQQFMCSSSSFGIWGISGFGSGISDTNSPVSALSYASRNDRVETSDVSLSANPSTLTFHNLGYADHNVVVTCLNATVMGAMTSTIRIAAGPTNCTWALAVLNTTSSTIAISLTVSACAGSKPNYKIQAITSLSGAVTPAQQINSTMYEISSLMASTAYDVQLVDTECPNVIIERLQVLTDMDSIAPPATQPSPSAAPPKTVPSPPSDACAGITAGVAVGCLALSLLSNVATGVVTFLCSKRCYKCLFYAM